MILFVVLAFLPTILRGDPPSEGLRYADITAKIAQWKRQYPKLVHETVLGKTIEGRPIPLIRLSDDAAPNAKEPGVLIMGGIHPREQQPPLCLLWLTDELLAGYGTNERFTRLLKDRQIYLIPLLNVDGKLYDETAPVPQPGRDWRKNRRVNSDGSIGVDLNRNFPVRWGGFRELDTTWRDTTANVRGNIYEGPASLSEPESKALAGFLQSHAKELRLFVDFHSPLRKVLTPNYVFGPDADHYQRLIDGVRERQTDKPYPSTEIKRDAEPKAGIRTGNTGLTYTYAYYVDGIYGMNIEIGLHNTTDDLPESADSLSAELLKRHYPSIASIRAEYEANIREPFLFLLETAGTLPEQKKGNIRLQKVATDKSCTPGSLVSWIPQLSDRGDYAILTSDSSDVVVQSEVRAVPVVHGFTLEIQPTAKPGTEVSLLLTVWDKERHVSYCRFPLKIVAAP